MMELKSNYLRNELPTSANLNKYLENNFIKEKYEIQNFTVNTSEDLFWKNNIEPCSPRQNSNFNFLKSCFPQLNFPVRLEIEKSTEYRDATLKGKFVPQNLQLFNIEDLSIEYCDSFAGKILVLTTENEDNFTKLIQSLCYKNNPIELPKSMGASFINGINNWGKINSLKTEWLKSNPLQDWSKEFSTNIVPNPTLFKDKLIILSSKPYSNIPNRTLGLSKSLWKEYSISIRKHHEYTHYYTLQKYGCATNNLHDELIADYVGIIKTLGYYDKIWMLNFMGLDNFPKYRNGSRLENYLKSSNELNSQEFNLLLEVVKCAIDNISNFNQNISEVKSDEDLLHRIDTLCETSLLDIASKNGSSIILNKYKELHQ